MRIVTPPSTLSPSVFDKRPLVQSKQAVEGCSYPREALARILEKYNQHIGNDQPALKNIQQLALSGSSCVVAGQQLGFMGGPAYTILKGISCVLVARATGAIPIFWLATEDHDIGEIDHTDTIDEKGNLKRFRLNFPKNGMAVEELILNEKHIEEVHRFCEFFKLENLKLPSVGDLYSTAMARVLVQLFAGTGLVFLEPKLLRPLAVPFFLQEIIEEEAIQNLLKSTTERLQKEGKETPISIGEGTNLFVRDGNGKRVKIHREKDRFIFGQEHATRQELLAKIAEQPDKFSPNVIARPALQNTLLPVVASIVGPTEMAYHQQLTDYFAFRHLATPLLVPRFSACFIPPESAAVLERCQLNPWDPIPHHWPVPLPSLGLPTHGLHLLSNLMHPHQHPQDRVLNWWTFQSRTDENLILSALNLFPWDSLTDYYCYL